MKNIVAITLAVLAVLLMGFLIYTFSQDGGKTTYLPNTFSTSRTLRLFQRDDNPETHTIYLGSPEESAFQVVSATGHYIDDDNKLSLTLWIEKLEADSFGHYKEKAWERYQSPSREGTSEKVTLSEHEVYLSFRTIDENIDDTSKMITMGGGYVFFPEDNVVVAYTLYNPRLHSCKDMQKPETCLFKKEVPLPTAEDNRKIAEQILSNRVSPQ